MAKGLKGMHKLQSLRNLSDKVSYNEDNFHRIAISNLSVTQKVIERWWEEKFQTPLKEYEDHTEEELYIKMLEDHYYNNPAEVDRFWQSLSYDDWTGETDEEYEKGIRERLERVAPKIDISKYQSEKEVSEDDLMEELRRQTPTKPNTMGDEIDDDYTIKKDIIGND